MTSQSGSERHSYDTKLRALAHFASSNSAASSARSSNVAESTVSTWIKSDEGIALVADIRAVMRHEVAANLISIARIATEGILERIQHGDEVILASGDRMRRMVPAKDLAYISAGAINQHALLCRDGESKQTNNLKALAADLIRAMRASTLGTIIDAMPTEQTGVGGLDEGE